MEIKKKRATSPQNGGKEPGRTLKLNLLKETKKDKDVREAPALKISGPEGEIVAGFLLKKSTKTNGWSRRWFVLNEKTGKLGYTKKQEDRYFRGVINLEESNIQEIEEEASQSKSSKSSKGEEKAPSLVFKITSKVSYKTLLKGLTLSGPTAHSTVVLKAETAAEKAEWLNKLKSITDDKEDQVVTKEDCPSIRQSQPDASLDTAPRKPADPEEELRWMVQEVRGYCEAVLNSLAANVPKAVVLCQVEKAKEEMLNKLYISVSSQSTLMIEELLQEDSNVKRKREKVQRQYSLLSQLARQLGHHDNQTVAPSTMSNGCLADNLRINGDSTGDDWRSAFDSAANGLLRLDSRSGSGGHSRRYSEPPQNGDAVLDSGSKSPHRPNQMQFAPHGFGHAF